MAQNSFGPAEPLMAPIRRAYDTVRKFGEKPAPKSDGTHERLVREANESFRKPAPKPAAKRPVKRTTKRK